MKWIDINKVQPRKGVEVLVYSTENGIKQDRYDHYNKNQDNKYWFYGDKEEYETSVTHWMPLPEPPTHS